MRLTKDTFIKMKTETSSKNLWKWEMGKCYIVRFNKVLVNKNDLDENGVANYYKESPSVICRKLLVERKIEQLIAEGLTNAIAEEQATAFVASLKEEHIIKAFEDDLTIPAFGKFMRPFDNRNGEEVNLKDKRYAYGSVVSERERDAEGKVKRTLIDELVGISAPIMKKKIEETEKQYANSAKAVREGQIDATKKTKPIGKQTVRVATEIIVMECGVDQEVDNKSINTLKTAGQITPLIWVLSAGKFDKVIKKLNYKGIDIHLDYIDLFINYEVKEDKAASGLAAEFNGVITPEVQLHAQVKGMEQMYQDYRLGAVYTKEAIEDKVYEFRTTPDALILQRFKVWLDANMNYVDADLKEKQAGLLEQVMNTSDEDDILNIVKNAKVNTEVIKEGSVEQPFSIPEGTDTFGTFGDLGEIAID